MISLSSMVDCWVGCYFYESIAEVILVFRFYMYSNERLLFAISCNYLVLLYMIFELAMCNSYCLDNDWVGGFVFTDLFTRVFTNSVDFSYFILI